MKKRLLRPCLTFVQPNEESQMCNCMKRCLRDMHHMPIFNCSTWLEAPGWFFRKSISTLWTPGPLSDLMSFFSPFERKDSKVVLLLCIKFEFSALNFDLSGKNFYLPNVATFFLELERIDSNVYFYFWQNFMV